MARAARDDADACNGPGSPPGTSAPFSRRNSVPAEEPDGALHAGHQPVHLVERVVHGERCSCGGGDPELAMQWPRAVVTHPHGNAFVVEDLADVVGVNAVDDE